MGMVTLLPTAAAALFAADARSGGLPEAAQSAAAASARGAVAELLSTAATALWDATMPVAALCEAAAASGAGSGGGSLSESGQHFHEEAPPLPPGSLQGGLRAGRLAAALSAYTPFAGGFANANHGDYAGGSVDVSHSDTGGGGSGGGGDANSSREGLVGAIVSRGRARMGQQRAAVASRWIRLRRLLNRALGTNEFFSVSILL